MNTYTKAKIMLALTGWIPLSRRSIAKVQLANIKMIQHLTMEMNGNKQFIMLLQFKVEELENRLNVLQPQYNIQDEDDPSYR